MFEVISVFNVDTRAKNNVETCPVKFKSDFTFCVNFTNYPEIRHFVNANKQKVTKCLIKTMEKIASDHKRGDRFFCEQTGCYLTVWLIRSQ